jgi:hypothetical protein
MIHQCEAISLVIPFSYFSGLHNTHRETSIVEADHVILIENLIYCEMKKTKSKLFVSSENFGKIKYYWCISIKIKDVIQRLN